MYAEPMNRILRSSLSLLVAATCSQLFASGVQLRVHVRPGYVVRYSVTSHGESQGKSKIKPTNERRKEIYKVQTVDKAGLATFHTSFQMSGGPHGPTKGDGELQLRGNGAPPDGFTSYVFDTAALSDLSYPSGPVSVGQRWSAGVKSFGKAVGSLIFTFKGTESVNGVNCAKLDVWAGTDPKAKDGIVGTATYWISLADGLPVKKTILQSFGGRWVSKIDVERK